MIRKFEDYYLGEEALLTHIVSEEDLKKFVDLTGDDNPLHVDEEFAKGTSFKKRVVHGMLGASFISTVIGTKLPGPGALWFEQRLRFERPVRIGDELTVRAKITHISASSRILVLETYVFNGDGTVVISGEAKVKVVKENKSKLNIKKMSNTKNIGAVIITGASGGIGSAVALKLASKGYSVAICYKSNEEKANELVTQIVNLGGKALSFQGDVSDESYINTVLNKTKKEFGRIVGIVNNASAPIEYKSILEADWKDFTRQLDVQTKALFLFSKLGSLSVLEGGSSSIVNVSSSYSENVPPSKMAAYSMSKAAASHLTRSLALEFGPSGIRFNNVSPGMTDTEMIADIPDKAKMIARMSAPLRRIANPEDVANVIAFLISNEAKHITGETIRVNGGSIMI